jgi:hypothetical protein
MTEGTDSVDERLALAADHKTTLEQFRNSFNIYSGDVFGNGSRIVLDRQRNRLQLLEPKVTQSLSLVLGSRSYQIQNMGSVKLINLLPMALMGGNNEMVHNFASLDTAVVSALNMAIGTVDAGLWPPKEPTPKLSIRDDELRNRCADLLGAAKNYDRALREATVILEDRLRRKAGHDILAGLIPASADQTGSHLVNTLCSPSKPVLIYSTDRSKRAAFQQMLLGVVLHLRNPSHHAVDDGTQWSWAWSVVGLIDRLIQDVEGCTVKAT